MHNVQVVKSSHYRLSIAYSFVNYTPVVLKKDKKGSTEHKNKILLGWPNLSANYLLLPLHMGQELRESRNEGWGPRILTSESSLWLPLSLFTPTGGCPVVSLRKLLPGTGDSWLTWDVAFLHVPTLAQVQPAMLWGFLPSGALQVTCRARLGYSAWQQPRHVLLCVRGTPHIFGRVVSDTPTSLLLQQLIRP